MVSWAQRKNLKYLLPGETQWFAKLNLALESHQVDEAVWDRQRPTWADGLAMMASARSIKPTSP